MQTFPYRPPNAVKAIALYLCRAVLYNSHRRTTLKTLNSGILKSVPVEIFDELRGRIQKNQKTQTSNNTADGAEKNFGESATLIVWGLQTVGYNFLRKKGDQGPLARSPNLQAKYRS